MGLRKTLAPLSGFMPLAIRDNLYPELWLKDHVDAFIRNVDQALAIKTHPLPYLELLFGVTNRLPCKIQIFGASIEIWLGKPVAQYYTFISETLLANETRETFHASTFLNPFQMELLAPPKKDSPPPGCTVILTVCCRSKFGVFEKTVKTTWKSPKIIPHRI